MKTAVVICPGRGTYNKTELGTLGRRFADKELLAAFDARRAAGGKPTLSALDGAATYSVATHTRGDNASALIYAATLADFAALDAERVRVVAVTGNSMGWYSTLACAGALSPTNGFEVVDTMGTLMQEHLIGGQIVHPVVDEDWRPDPARKAALLALVAEIDALPGHRLALSIDLGGMLVVAGDEAGLAAFQARVEPAQGRFPLRLANHAAFHTALQAPVAELGRGRLPPSLFEQPKLPMVDGRGHVWWPGTTDVAALWDYTLGHQVTETYDFTRAVEVAAREFAPDLFVVTGPGTTLGGAVAQSLILADWAGMTSKAAFQAIQAKDPLLISMGMDDQRALVAR
ncbi:ACP S-malonyltransferase [Pinisolibacter aquiterrae]|uniref:ACP S-malonyltransferase n=1 Tax=Pinisolibacter aquiterrae TaxID=2815579 RepID=UPI001C3E77FE|nr:ACP S-malonyltransferase [Pinisolibacter aquiterrae]MBV5265718.1 ACP S-malonyltransferase [Pinisolibacter aquiterrae]MCC8236717.1 ACP S-malonyltransferase [Pinisolibacter aquiterrae]